MRFALAMILALSSAGAGAQLYRWTDEAGRTHMSDSPPPAGAKNVQKKGGGAASGTAAGSGTAASPGAAEPYALQQARKSYPVTLYSTPGCEACDEARKVLNARGIPFKESSVTDEASINELKKAVGSNSVPSIIVGSTVFKGFEEGAVHRMLDAAGYPKTGILPPRTQTEPGALERKAEVAPTAPEPAKGPYATDPPAPLPGKAAK